MEELESLIADLNSSLEAKKWELIKNGHYNVFTKTLLTNANAEIKLFEVDCAIYFKNKIQDPDVIEKIKKEYFKIKAEIGGIS